MLRFVAYILRFLALAVMVYLGLMFAMANIRINNRPLATLTGDYYKNLGGATWETFREFEPDSKFEVVVIGSSHAYRGYDPFLFQERGYRAFNLGTTAQTPFNSYHLIKHLLDSSNCSLLIIDLYEGVLGQDGLEPTSDLALNMKDATPVLGMAWELRDLRAINVLTYGRIYRDHDLQMESSDYRGLGFATVPDSAANIPDGPKKPARLSKTQKEYIVKCIQLCEQRGIQVVFASHFGRGVRRGLYHTSLAAYMDSILAGSNIPYLDFNDVAGIEDASWFHDENHLNTTGAKLFTEQLIDSLEALGYLRSPIAQ